MVYTPPAGFHGSATLGSFARSEGAALLQSQFVITGSFMVTTDADSGPGSLREAILESNGRTGSVSTIEFAIPGAGTHTIALQSPLPAATASVLIDGTTQPGYAGTPLIAIDPAATGRPDSLTISGSDATVSGLAIRVFGLGSAEQPSSVMVGSGLLEPGPISKVIPYQIDTATQGRFTARLHTQALTASLVLVDSRGNRLVRSDGASPGDRDLWIDEDLSAGSYTLNVEISAGAGTYVVTTALAPASAPFQAVPVETDIQTVVAGDFNADSRADLVLADSGSIELLLGNGDGTFQTAKPIAAVGGPLATGDFNSDRNLDLVVANLYLRTVSILLGNGDGTFQPFVPYEVGLLPSAVVTGKFNDDAILDLAVGNTTTPRAAKAPCLCCWATATALFRLKSLTRWGRRPHRSLQASSTATAAPTSPSPTAVVSRYSWATVTARSGPRDRSRASAAR